MSKSSRKSFHGTHCLFSLFFYSENRRFFEKVLVVCCGVFTFRFSTFLLPPPCRQLRCQDRICNFVNFFTHASSAVFCHLYLNLSWFSRSVCSLEPPLLGQHSDFPTGWTTKRSVCSKASRPSLGSTQPAGQWVAGPHSLREKRLWCEADHSTQPNDDATNAWSSTSTSP